jgi:excinuclease ABC subunit A
VSIEIPLQTLCVVTGVSGSGKSSLVVDALYPALRNALHDERDSDDRQCKITNGIAHLSDVQLLEQNPLPRSNRSIPATYLGVFDEIRKLLAETHEARKRNFTPGTFSFNSARGGRCERCRGHGWITIDMQFLADVETTCENCQGKRFRGDVLDVRYRDRSVHEILNMTAEQAFVFFNGHHRIQKSLNGLRQAGLGYLTLGQSLSTLSGGEAQRLRIAGLLSGVPNSEGSPKRETVPGQRLETGTLFILDEPSNGLHAHDSDRLMSCLRQLTQVGHSILLIEHDRRLIRQCDYQIKMGPGPGRHGGRIINTGRFADSECPG